jgi:hypothetical protein
MQIRRVSTLGDFMNFPGNVFGNPGGIPGFQNLPGGAFANPGLMPGRFQSLPNVFGNAQSVPEEAPAPAAPGAVLPTNAPTYLFPVNQEVQAPAQTPAAPEAQKGLSATTLIIGGVVLVGAIVAIALATR